MPLRRRILLAALLALAALFIGYGIYRVFFSSGRVVTQPSPASGGGGKLPTSGAGLPRATSTPPARTGTNAAARTGLTLARSISGGAAAAPIVSPDGKSVSFYDPSSGLFFRVGADGTRIPLSGKAFMNVQTVTWAPGQDQAVLEFPDGSNVLYDFSAGRQVTLPKHWEAFSFSTDGSSLAAKSIGTDPDNRWLVVANPDGSGATPIEPLGGNADKVSLDWSPRKDIVGFSRTGTEIGFGREEIIPLGLKGENLRGLTVEGFGFQSTWNSDGSRLVYSVYSQESGYRPELWVVDGRPDRLGEGRTRLNIQTWADKCVAASSATLYCAVPVDLPEGTGFERSLADGVADRIVRVDLATGQQSLVAAPESGSSISKLLLSADGRTLYLHETGTGLVKKLDL